MPNEAWFERWLPPIGPAPERRPAPPYSLRHPTDADFAALDQRLRNWADTSADRPGAWRTWIRDFGSSSWMAETGERPIGLLVGFESPARRGEAVIERIAVDPEMRRRGIGRALVDTFAAGVAGAGGQTIRVACRPDDHGALRFFGAVGFDLDESSGKRLYGVPAWPDWDGEGEDRALLIRRLGG